MGHIPTLICWERLYKGKVAITDSLKAFYLRLILDWRSVPVESEDQIIEKIRSMLLENGDVYIEKDDLKAYTGDRPMASELSLFPLRNFSDWRKKERSSFILVGQVTPFSFLTQNIRKTLPDHPSFMSYEMI